MSAGDGLRPDVALTVEFLGKWAPGGPYVLTAINPDGPGIRARTFAASQSAELTSWVQAQNDAPKRWNVYFNVNPTSPTLRCGERAKREDITRVAYFHVDADPSDGADLTTEQERILRLLEDPTTLGVPLPTVIVFSGGGYGAYWKLDNPIPIEGDLEKAEEAKRYNIQLELLLGGDTCHDVSRIMRLPGTVNWPGKKKLKKGRVPALARVVTFDEKRVYSVNQFEKAAVSSIGSVSVAIPRLFASVDEIEPLAGDEHAATRALIRLAGSNEELANEVPGDIRAEIEKFPSRSEAVLRVACDMVRAGCDESTVIGVLLDPKFAISESCREKGASAESYARRQYQKAYLFACGDCVPITIEPGCISEALDSFEQALLVGRSEVFQRGGELVRVARLDTERDSQGVVRRAGALTIVPATQYWLREQMGRVAKWSKYDGRAKKPVVIDPPLALATHYQQRVGEWGLPVLNSIVEAPTLRQDLSVVESHGFDERSCLYLDLGGVRFPGIPDAPTKVEAERALEHLASMFRCFPFVPDDACANWQPTQEEGSMPSVSRSVVLSAVLTGLIRRSLRSAPMHGIDAPEKGTGKSLIADVISVLLTGRTATVMNQGVDEAEDEKRLLAVLREGCPLLVVDNIERPLEGQAFCSILTQEQWQSRLLGHNESIRVPTNTLFIATGNNLAFRGDMTRRAVVCRMDARDERPDARQFDFDPREVARKQREKLVVAGLTMIRAYVAAGRPLAGKVPHVGSFEDWTLVREVLIWLGQPDPAKSREAVVENDPAKEELAEVMEAWAACFGDSQKRVGQVVAYLSDGCGYNDANRDRLLRALISVSGDGKLNSKRIGHWLARNAGKIIDGRKFHRQADSSRGARVALLSTIQPDASTGSESPKAEVSRG